MTITKIKPTPSKPRVSLTNDGGYFGFFQCYTLSFTVISSFCIIAIVAYPKSQILLITQPICLAQLRENHIIFISFLIINTSHLI